MKELADQKTLTFKNIIEVLIGRKAMEAGGFFDSPDTPKVLIDHEDKPKL